MGNKLSRKGKKQKKKQVINEKLKTAEIPWVVEFTSRFPKEIFQVILSFLPSNTDLIQVALVCKEFFDIVRKLSFRAKLQFFFPWKGMEVPFRSYLHRNNF
jgi:hypothetical protein